LIFLKILIILIGDMLETLDYGLAERTAVALWDSELCKFAQWIEHCGDSARFLGDLLIDVIDDRRCNDAELNQSSLKPQES
jgi:uncharacterized protein CbrC (UPF0167 family)